MLLLLFSFRFHDPLGQPHSASTQALVGGVFTWGDALYRVAAVTTPRGGRQPRAWVHPAHKRAGVVQHDPRRDAPARGQREQHAASSADDAADDDAAASDAANATDATTAADATTATAAGAASSSSSSCPSVEYPRALRDVRWKVRRDG